MDNPERLIRFDWAIKSLLRDKANFDIMEGFLSALLKSRITIQEVLESESNQDAEKQKFNRVDILVRDGENRLFIIEVQAETESDYLERLLFGTCKTVVDNLKVGEPYRNIKKVISISIMYFNLGRGNDYLYHGRTKFKGVHTGEILEVRKVSRITDENNRAVRVIETKSDMYPEYYLIEVERFGDVIREDIDEWVYFFKNEEIREDFHSLNIQAAREKLKILKMGVKERKAYENYLMLLASERDAIETARAEGMEEGKKEGIAKGMEEGKKEGVAQSLLTVLKLLGPLPFDLEQKIMAQGESDTLQNWLMIGVRSKSIDEFVKTIENQ